MKNLNCFKVGLVFQQAKKHIARPISIYNTWEVLDSKNPCHFYQTKYWPSESHILSNYNYNSGANYLAKHPHPVCPDREISIKCWEQSKITFTHLVIGSWKFYYLLNELDVKLQPIAVW